jgi:hypothetical protein
MKKAGRQIKAAMVKQRAAPYSSFYEKKWNTSS